MGKTVIGPKIGYDGPGHYRVRIEVISQEGHCANGHKLGDAWECGHVTPEGICMAAFGAMAARLQILEFGGCFPWREDKDEMQCACPDGKNPVIFRLRRLKKEEES